MGSYTFSHELNLFDLVQSILSVISILVTIWLGLYLTTYIDKFKEINKISKEFIFERINYQEKLLKDLKSEINTNNNTICYFKAVSTCKSLNTSLSRVKKVIIDVNPLFDFSSYDSFLAINQELNTLLTTSSPNSESRNDFCTVNNNIITVPTVLVSRLDHNINVALDHLFDYKFAIIKL